MSEDTSAGRVTELRLKQHPDRERDRSGSGPGVWLGFAAEHDHTATRPEAADQPAPATDMQVRRATRFRVQQRGSDSSARGLRLPSACATGVTGKNGTLASRARWSRPLRKKGNNRVSSQLSGVIAFQHQRSCRRRVTSAHQGLAV